MTAPRLGRYELGDLLGEGGAGRVVAAVMCGPGDLRKPVALKVLHEGHEELRREARLGGLLRHRHLVDVYEVGEDDGQWFCAMERCDGSLADLAPLPPRAVVEAGVAVCRALQYAHEDLGLVHLDVKPQNLLHVDGVVKLADLGIATAEGFTGDGRVRGTPGYMAPEQLTGGTVDARTDIHALGVTLIELACGLGTRGSETVSFWTEVQEDPDPSLTITLDDDHIDSGGALGSAPPWLDPIVARCLADHPSDRWPDMASLADALAVLPVEGPGLAQHLGLPQAAAATGSAGWPEVPELCGRTPDRRRLGAALDEPGVVWLHGPAGVGKSALAWAVGAAWQTEGRWGLRAGLGDARGSEGLVGAVARALDLALSAKLPTEQLGHVLASRGAGLLLLDDADAVMGLAEAVACWRRVAPQLRVVVTARAAPPDGLPATAQSLGPLDVVDACEVLVAGARQRGVDPSREPRLSELARTLDGLPLALELAAGRLGVLSVDDLLERLDLGLLRSAAGGRHATLEAAL